MIHFADSFYANELYNAFGQYVYSLAEAITEAERQFPEGKWEVYNGNEAYINH